jgi:hypothetical protein
MGWSVDVPTSPQNNAGVFGHWVWEADAKEGEQIEQPRFYSGSKSGAQIGIAAPVKEYD